MTQEQAEYKTLIFDLDDTLYPPQAGLMAEVGRRIGAHVRNVLGLDAEAADRLRKRYKDDYGSSLTGLVYIDGIDPAEYIRYVYDIDYSNFLTPDLQLVALLRNLPHDKIIFTNGSLVHAEGVLHTLGMDGIFSRIIPIEAVDYHGKPMALGFEKMIRLTGIVPEQTLFFDDQERNTKAAASWGMGAVTVNGLLSDILATAVTPWQG